MHTRTKECDAICMDQCISYCMGGVQEAQTERAKLKAHAYLKPSVLRQSWREVLRSVQQETRSVIMVPRVPPQHVSATRDHAQHAEHDSSADKISVATSDIAAQHGILHAGDVRPLASPAMLHCTALSPVYHLHAHSKERRLDGWNNVTPSLYRISYS